MYMRLVDNSFLTDGVLDNFVTLHSGFSGIKKTFPRPGINAVYSDVTKDFSNIFTDSTEYTPASEIQTVLFDEILLREELVPNSRTDEDADLILLATYLGLDYRSATNEEIMVAIDLLPAPASLINTQSDLIFFSKRVEDLCLALIDRQGTNEINEGTIVQSDINTDSRISQTHLGKREWQALLDEIDSTSNAQNSLVIKNVTENYPWNSSALTSFNSALSPAPKGGK